MNTVGCNNKGRTILNTFRNLEAACLKSNDDNFLDRRSDDPDRVEIQHDNVPYSSRQTSIKADLSKGRLVQVELEELSTASRNGRGVNTGHSEHYPVIFKTSIKDTPEGLEVEETKLTSFARSFVADRSGCGVNRTFLVDKVTGTLTELQEQPITGVVPSRAPKPEEAFSEFSSAAYTLGHII